MKSYVLLLFGLCCVSGVRNFQCDQRTATVYFKKPIYEFSRRILDRVSIETDGHFVFSPISTWLQLLNTAEGAQGNTLRELRNVTGQHPKTCMQKILRKTLNYMNEDLKSYKSLSLVIVDSVYRVKQIFKNKLELLDTVKVKSLDFNNAQESANEANNIISQGTSGEIFDVVEPSDFNFTTLLLADAVSFSSSWKQPFNPSYTNLENFYYLNIPTGQVMMMTQTGYFNYKKVNQIDAEVLELPCGDGRRSMLIFLPIKKNIKDLYLYLKEIRLSTLFNLFKKAGEQLVTVKLPRFKIETEVENLPEIVNDMGVYDVFYPEVAMLRGISDYKIYVSSMKQKVKIAVMEEGVSASNIAESFIDEEARTINYFANRPFAYMLVDKPTEIILFAGVYSVPSLLET